MATLKTTPNDASVLDFLATVQNDKRRLDCEQVMAIMQEITNAPPKMWGGTIIGFGDYHYVYASGREGDWFLTGLSPRKQSLTLYIMAGLNQHQDLLSQLGKCKTGKGCLYINKLEDVNLDILKILISLGVDQLKELYSR